MVELLIFSWVFLPPGALQHIWHKGWFREWPVSIVNRRSLAVSIKNHFPWTNIFRNKSLKKKIWPLVIWICNSRQFSLRNAVKWPFKMNRNGQATGVKNSQMVHYKFFVRLSVQFEKQQTSLFICEYYPAKPSTLSYTKVYWFVNRAQ